MHLRLRSFFAVLFFCSALSAHADSLPLAPELISLTSDAGEQLLIESDARRPYLPLTVHFVTQKNQAYCGVASMVMVLNALVVPAPDTKEYAPFRQFTQDNVLNESTERILPQSVIDKQGMTLDELGAVLTVHGVATKVRHASDVTEDVSRREVQFALSQPKQHVLVNYLRKSLGQEKGGHISPIAAYDVETDRFLILDVSRYKYPPVWVKADHLYAAMNTPDADNQGRSRGYVLVRHEQ